MTNKKRITKIILCHYFEQLLSTAAAAATATAAAAWLATTLFLPFSSTSLNTFWALPLAFAAASFVVVEVPEQMRRAEVPDMHLSVKAGISGACNLA